MNSAKVLDDDEDASRRVGQTNPRARTRFYRPFLCTRVGEPAARGAHTCAEGITPYSRRSFVRAMTLKSSDVPCRWQLFIDNTATDRLHNQRSSKLCERWRRPALLSQFVRFHRHREVGRGPPVCRTAVTIRSAES